MDNVVWLGPKGRIGSNTTVRSWTTDKLNSSQILCTRVVVLMTEQPPQLNEENPACNARNVVLSKTGFGDRSPREDLTRVLHYI